MAHARSFRSRTNAGARRHVSWDLGPSGASGNLTTSSVVVFPVASQALTDDLTVVRLRGRLQVALSIAGSAGEGFSWAFGICNVTENAAAIGVTAVPDPQLDLAWDGWFVHEQGTLFARDSTPLDDPNLMQHIVIDSKAMRKTHRTDVIIAVFGVTETGTATMRADLVSRLLDKLP